MRKKALIISMLFTAFAAVSLTGCGERVTETEAQTETETETEEMPSEIQIETQPQTEIQTEAPTEAPTEPPTEAPVIDEDLTPEQEVERLETFTEGVYYYANDAVNVRETPDTTADNVISSYESGDEVYVVGKTPHWYKVEGTDHNGDYFAGYASKDYITNPNEAEEPAVQETAVEPAAEQQTVEESVVQEEAANTASAAPEVIPAAASYADSFPIQAASAANVRVSPSENGDVFAVVNAGDQLTAIGESGDWYEVDYNGSVGYIHKNLIA